MTRAAFFRIIPAAVIGFASCTDPRTPVEITITNGQGEIAGEVTSTSVILQSRLTSKGGWVDGDLPGASGVARFEISTNPDFSDATRTDWIEAIADNDFIVKAKIGNLIPGTDYFYRVVYGPDDEYIESGAIRSFGTLPGASASTQISFTVVTGMNYHQFFNNPSLAYTGPDKELGYPALVAMETLKPDFFVATGDSVYYDVPFQGRAETDTAMRKKWHEQFGKQRFIDFFSAVPTYWEKDDHDYRYNDSDNTTSQAPLPHLGQRIFLEQVPIVDPSDPTPVTYRTHRISKDLQIWLTEGRDHRSSNTAPPGPSKTLWGADQLDWFKQTLTMSDATFKILISPTPMIGPDDATRRRQGTSYGTAGGANRAQLLTDSLNPLKRDNHSNPGGFQHERDQLFDWLTDNSFLEKNFYIVVGDRHWQYHSEHPNGFEEFSTGAIIDANSRAGRLPGDPNSNDPDAMILQHYTYEEPTGGFLNIVITPGDAVTAAFRFFDEQGELLYENIKTAN